MKQNIASVKDKVSQLLERVKLSEFQSCMFKQAISTELRYLCKPQDCSQLLSLECLSQQLQDGPLKLSVDGRPLVFRLSGYTQLKLKRRNWFSPSFCEHNGYRICMSVHVNGGGGEGGGGGASQNACGYLSVSFHLKSSKNDDQLQWPVTFFGGFAVTLMPQVTPSASKSNLAQEVISVSELESESIRFLACVKHSLKKAKSFSRVKVGQTVAISEQFCTLEAADQLAYQDSLVFRVGGCSQKMKKFFGLSD